jgi:hypothetical protein
MRARFTPFSFLSRLEEVIMEVFPTIPRDEDPIEVMLGRALTMLPSDRAARFATSTRRVCVLADNDADDE